MNDKIKVSVYLNKKTTNELVQAKEKTGRPYGEIVDEALRMYFDIPVRTKAQEMLKPAESKVDILNQKADYLIKAANAQYRVLAYIAYLLTGGIPVVKPNGTFILKPNNEIRNVARKKALTNYSQLRQGNTLPEEEFLSEEIEQIDEDVEPVKDEIKEENIISYFH